jgi:DNA-binding protein HU-beta
MHQMPAKTTVLRPTYPQNIDFINKIAIFITKTLDKSNKMLYICTIKNQKSKTMNKAELIDAIASGAKLTKADAAKALDATIEAINKALKKGDRVQLIGFGSFSVTKRSARTGRNPQTGKEIKIPAKKVVKFKAGAELATSVNKGK